MRPRLALSVCLLLTAALNGATPEEVALGESVEGRPIVARVWGESERCLLILASIHGSEPAGTPLVERLEAWFVEHPRELAERRVAIVPIANPDGYAKRERFNANGVDLNRNFPTGNRTERKIHGESALSEPESRALMRALQVFDPVRVVSLHQPIACVDYDGPGEALAEAMSAAIERRLPVKKLGGRPGSLGSYVGVTLGRPIITLELPKHAEDRPAEELWRDYGPALIAFLRAD
ncbi:murein peptide amidase A [Planctomycetes bacterium MalM25]|nr:murein peptide amidase A [Planctomycetes bacterium MalM25]